MISGNLLEMENVLNTFIEKLTPGPLFYIILALGIMIYILGVENIREYIIQKRINKLKDDNQKIQANDAYLLQLLLRLKRDVLNFEKQLKGLDSGVIDYLPDDLPHFADNLKTSYNDTLAYLEKSKYVLRKNNINMDEMYRDLLNGKDDNENKNKNS